MRDRNYGYLITLLLFVSMITSRVYVGPMGMGIRQTHIKVIEKYGVTYSSIMKGGGREIGVIPLQMVGEKARIRQANTVVIIRPKNDTIYSGAFQANWTVDTTGTYTTWITTWNRTWQQKQGQTTGTGKQNYTTTITLSPGVYLLKAKTDTGLESETTIIAVDPNYNPQPDETKGKFLVENHTTFADYATLQGYAYTTYSPGAQRLNRLDIIIGNQTYTIRDAGWNDILRQPEYFINCTFTIDIELPEGNHTAILQATIYWNDPELPNRWRKEKLNLSIVNFTIDKTPPVVYTNITNGSTYATNNITIEISFNDKNMDYHNYTLRNAETQEIIDYGDGYGNATIVLSKNLEDGKYVLELYAEDTCVPPHIVRKEYYFNIDTQPPVVVIIEPTNNSVVGKMVWINISCYDLHPNLVWLVIDNNIVASWEGVGEFLYIWNTTSITDGVHEIVVYANDTVGNLGSYRILVNVDNTPPTVIIVAPDNNSIVIGIVEINISTNDPHGNTTWVVIDGVAVASWDGTGNFIYSWNTSGLYGRSCEIIAYSNDSVGNIGSYRIILKVFGIASPKNNSYLNDTSVTVEWYYSEDLFQMQIYLNCVLVDTVDANVTRYDLFLDEGAWNITLLAFGISGDKFSDTVIVFVDLTPPSIAILHPSSMYVNSTFVEIIWDYSDNSGVNCCYVYVDGETTCVGLNTSHIVSLDEGSHQVGVIVIDVAGNVKRYLFELVVDLTAPILLTISPANNTYTNGTITWAFIDSYGIDHYEICVDNGSWIVVLEEKYILTEYGEHTVRVKAVDPAGNIAICTIYVTVDFIPPEIFLIKPENLTAYFTNQIVISWECWDNYGISRFVIQYDNISISPPNNSLVLTLPEGKHVIVLKAVDFAGNTKIVTIIIYIDLTPPRIEITSPADCQYLNTTKVYLSWEYVEINLDHFEVRVDFGEWTSVGRNTSCTLLLDDGQHIVEVAIVDIAGNRETDNITIYIDTEPPTIHVLKPENNSKVYTQEVTIEFEVSDNVAIDNIYVLIGDERVNISGHTVVVSLSKGRNIILIKAMDKAGNVRNALLVLYYEGGPMTILAKYVPIISYCVIIALIFLIIKKRRGKKARVKEEISDQEAILEEEDT